MHSEIREQLTTQKSNEKNEQKKSYYIEKFYSINICIFQLLNNGKNKILQFAEEAFKILLGVLNQIQNVKPYTKLYKKSKLKTKC